MIVTCKPGCTCGRHSKDKQGPDTPYDMPQHGVPKGRFVPLGDGSYKAAVLSNGER